MSLSDIKTLIKFCFVLFFPFFLTSFWTKFVELCTETPYWCPSEGQANAGEMSSEVKSSEDSFKEGNT